MLVAYVFKVIIIHAVFLAEFLGWGFWRVD